MAAQAQLDRVRRISGASPVWDSPWAESLLWGEYADTPTTPATPVSASDSTTLAVSESVGMALQLSLTDSTTVSLGEAPSVLPTFPALSLTDTLTGTLSDTASVLVTSTLADTFILSLAENHVVVVGLIALCVEGHDALDMQLEGRFQLSKVFWPQEGAPPTSNWVEEAKQPSAVWVLQVESLDSGFTKSNNLEKR